jgi:hypothetical protein
VLTTVGPHLMANFLEICRRPLREIPSPSRNASHA